jgi:hypothetical protein
VVESSESTMATPLDNIVIPWLCGRPPEYITEMSSLEARRMLAKLGELHQPVHPCPRKKPGAAWGNTCLDRPCEQYGVEGHCAAPGEVEGRAGSIWDVVRAP